MITSEALIAQLAKIEDEPVICSADAAALSRAVSISLSMVAYALLRVAEALEKKA